MRLKNWFPLLSAMTVMMALVFLSCNKKTEDEEEIAVTASTVAVKNFVLQPNSKVLSHLDSVFFSIDLRQGVIYNADSLPKGTDVSRLVPTITFMNSLSHATITFTKDNLKDTTVNYLTNPADSIDFTYPVRMNLVAQDGLNSMEYVIKVNVHRQDPDSLIWDRVSSSALPTVSGKAVAQKTIKVSESFVSLIKETDGSFTILKAEDPSLIPESIPEQIQLGFEPEIESFSWTAGNFYLLSDRGVLMKSSDLNSWEDTGESWITIIGTYSDHILGLKDIENIGFYHCGYPQDGYIPEAVADDNFPIKGRTSLGEFSTEWSPLPVAICAGGEDKFGNLTDDVWAFDGETWTIIGESAMTEPFKDSMLVRYVVFRNNGKPFSTTEYDVWLLFGGVNENNEFNQTVYMSFDNGISWKKASEYMQLPKDFPRLAKSDCFISSTQMESDISQNWTTLSTNNPGRWMKISYTLDGYEITWDCPYIYIIGGYTEEAQLSDMLWRAVLARLTFTPLF